MRSMDGVSARMSHHRSRSFSSIRGAGGGDGAAVSAWRLALSPRDALARALARSNARRRASACLAARIAAAFACVSAAASSWASDDDAGWDRGDDAPDGVASSPSLDMVAPLTLCCRVPNGVNKDE